MRRTMLSLMPSNTTFGFADDEDYTLIGPPSFPTNDIIPQSREPNHISEIQTNHNWGDDHMTEDGSLRLPLLVIVACVVIPALIAAAIIFAVVKFRRRKLQAGGGIHYIECDSKSGQVNNAYKTPVDAPSVCFEKSDEVKMNLARMTKPGHVQCTEGKIPVSIDGGLFHFKQNNTLVSIPRDIDTYIKEVHLGFNIEKNVPDYVVQKNILSDVITLSPHNATFDRHVMVRIPIIRSKVKDIQKIQLMYSCTGEGEKPAWINLQPCNKNIRHLDPIFWMMIGEECYLFTTHFCHVFVTQFCSVLEQSALFLQASVHSEYDEDLNEVKLHVGFHCGKCNPDMLKGKQEYGKLVGKCYKCIYGREGGLKVKSDLTDPLWKTSVPEMDIDTEDLLNLCNLDDIFPPLTFVYRPEPTHQQTCAATIAQVKILQGQRKPVIIQGSIKTAPEGSLPSKKLQPLNMRKASDPVEHVDLSCSPREHSEDIPALSVPPTDVSLNIDNLNLDEALKKNKTPSENGSEDKDIRVSSNFTVALETGKVSKENMSLPAVFTSLQNSPPKLISEPERNGGSIFEDHVRYEEKELCKLLDEKTEFLTAIAEEIGLTQELCVSRHLDGQRMLQIWKILVITHQKTWVDLHSTLVKMKMVEAAHQLKMAYEKDLMI